MSENFVMLVGLAVPTLSGTQAKMAMDRRFGGNTWIEGKKAF